MVFVPLTSFKLMFTTASTHPSNILILMYLFFIDTFLSFDTFD